MFADWMFSPPPPGAGSEKPISRSSVLVCGAAAWALSLARLGLAAAHHETGIDPSLALLAAILVPYPAANPREASPTTSAPSFRGCHRQGSSDEHLDEECPLDVGRFDVRCEHLSLVNASRTDVEGA